MSITRFRPEIWSANLLVALRKRLVYAGPGVVNRDYEGDISAAGDTVRITSIGDPTIGTYSPNVTSITPEELTDAQRTLVIDQAKYFAFYVDDVDQRQAKGNVIPEAMRRAAYKLADTVDQYVAALYTGTQSANIVAAGAAQTFVLPTAGTPGGTDDFYNKILIPLKVKLDEANIPTEGRFCIVPPWAHGVLLLSNLFVRQDASGTTEGLRNGMVGRAAGFDIMVSNNVPLISSDYAIIAGTDMAISFAEQINKTEAYRPEAKFADAVKGLMLYGSKLVRPEGLAYARCTRPSGI
jgi:capsid protein